MREAASEHPLWRLMLGEPILLNFRNAPDLQMEAIIPKGLLCLSISKNCDVPFSVFNWHLIQAETHERRAPSF